MEDSGQFRLRPFAVNTGAHLCTVLAQRPALSASTHYRRKETGSA